MEGEVDSKRVAVNFHILSKACYEPLVGAKTWQGTAVVGCDSEMHCSVDSTCTLGRNSVIKFFEFCGKM